MLCNTLWLGSLFCICQLNIQVLFSSILFFIKKKPKPNKNNNKINPEYNELDLNQPENTHALTFRGLPRNSPQQVKYQRATQTVFLMQATGINKGYKRNWREGFLVSDWKPPQGCSFSSSAQFRIMRTPLKVMLVGTTWWKQDCWHC